MDGATCARGRTARSQGSQNRRRGAKTDILALPGIPLLRFVGAETWHLATCVQGKTALTLSDSVTAWAGGSEGFGRAVATLVRLFQTSETLLGVLSSDGLFLRSSVFSWRARELAPRPSGGRRPLTPRGTRTPC